MKQQSLLFLAVISIGFLLILTTWVWDAYGHGVSTGGVSARPVRILNEQFSPSMISVSTGDVIIVDGLLESVSDREYKLSPYIFADTGEIELLRTLYPPYKDQASWYFRVESSLPHSFVLNPYEQRDYEIRIYPLKAGVYHVHSFFRTDIGAFIGPGETIVVTGSSSPTLGEITQLYLPLGVGFASIVVFVPAVWKLSASKVKEKLLRTYFAFKSSLETVWLSALVFSIVFAPTFFYQLEGRFALFLGMTVFLAAISFGGYVTATTKRKLQQQRLFIVGTSIATLTFYIMLSLTGIGHIERQLDVNGGIFLVVFVVNILVAIYGYLLIRKQRATDVPVFKSSPI